MSQAAPAPTFSFHDHRLQVLKQNMNPPTPDETDETEQPMELPPAPPPPMISAAPPPINRRRIPKRMALSPAPPPMDDNDELPAYSAIKSANSVLSQNNVESAYSNINTGMQNVLQLPRARTPVSAVKHLVSPPVSAPMPNNNLISPLLRSPMSTASLRMRDRSDSFREQKDSDSYRSRDWDRTDYRERDRPPKSARASPIPRSPVPLPLRSANRPGSAMSQRTPVAVPQHEGMI